MSARFGYTQCKQRGSPRFGEAGVIQAPIIIGAVIVLAIGFFLLSQGKLQFSTKPSSEANNTKEINSVKPTAEENTGSSKITTEQARMVVNNLPEVLEYLKEVPNGKIEVDNELEGEYNVHVYEFKNGHTATFNWYTVDIKTGKPVAQFDLGKAKETSTARGTISGKLCYPSEVLPEGVIEAKRLSDNKVFILDYGGSETGEGNIYEFPLENGNYYLRYKTKASLMGYSTTVCPTGKEETCGDTKLRILRKAEVKTGEKVSNYDLCDFYFKDSNAPKF